MTPSVNGFLEHDFEIEEQSNKTYYMYYDQKRIIGYVDGISAIEQLIYKILNTERYLYPIYSSNFGVEFLDLYGEPTSYVCPEIRRRITEALTQDSRIQGVENFDFIVDRGKVHVNFTVSTLIGDVSFEKVVNF